jgi:CubicO group peptidase (beta-lactamase class C family)
MPQEADRSPPPAAPIDTGGQTADGQDLTPVIARGQRLDLGGDYVLPPGDPVTHFGAGMAKVLASNIFLTGLEPGFAAEHVGYFTAPYEERGHVVDIDVDTAGRAVRVSLDNGVARIARIFAGQGAVTLPLGAEDVFFTPSTVTPDLPPPDDLPWPMGDIVEEGAGGLDQGAIAEAADLAFTDAAMTAAVVVTHRGQIVAERYREGIGIHTPLESWSMGKSLTATLLALLIRDGVYDLWQPAPIPEWQQAGDARAQIRIADILRMSSGLRFRAMQDPEYDPALGYPDHRYVYTGGIDAFSFAASRPQQWPPNQVGRYRNGDPVLANYLVRLGVEGRGADYHAFPQRALFDKLGMRDTILETDPYGNFLLQGYELASARDWARLGNLYLNDGVWNGERLLPEGWTEFVSTLAPAWAADGRPIYGGFFWLNGAGQMPIPREAYFMSSAGGQKTVIVPSHDLVVVRIGHYSGVDAAVEPLNRALAALMRAVPPS